ncbi:MAG: hypothetical protein ACLFP2_01605 [Candidatus Woesearchaeota archaeon]
MKKLLLIGIVIFIVACQQGEDRTYERDIYKGSEGIIMEFARDSPPDQVMQKQNFPVGFIIENRGASDVNESYISLIVEDEFIDVLEWNDINTKTTKFGTLSLRGKDQTNPEGEKKRAVIQMKSKELKDMVETQTSLLSINLCYNYNTLFSESTCIDSNIFETTDRKKSCEIETLTSSGTGAPVAITEIKPQMLAHDSSTITPEYKLTIKNVGDGQIINSGKTEKACTSESFSHKDFNDVEISVAQLSGHNMDCEPNPVKLRDGKATTFCRLPGGVSVEAGNYKTTINFQLRYGYTTNIADSVEIRKFIE